MVRSVEDAFTVYLQRQTPSASERQAAALHRASVETAVRGSLDVYRFLETGSFHHGTGVARRSDVDVLVSLKATQPSNSDTALGWLRAGLAASFPRTAVRVSRPAVVVPFGGGYETFEVIPGFVKDTSGEHRYAIPAPAGGWMESTPEAHLKYVNGANADPGGAKSLSRLLKAWKYHQNVPVSSFYLEMRAAQHMKTQAGFLAVWDLCLVLEKLDGHSLAGMQDPTGNTGLIRATSSVFTAIDAQTKTHTAAVRARKALDAYQAEKWVDAFFYLDLLFGGTFPAR